MIAIAVISILAAIAIPAYNGYIDTAREGSLRMSVAPLKVFMEDYQLENGTYAVSGATLTEAQLGTSLSFVPDDAADRTYAIQGASASDYEISVIDDSSNKWILCENRAADCCFGNNGTIPANCP